MKFSSKEYWENRYINNGNSGSGSYNEFARFKAGVINKFIGENQSCETYLELGCGDGNQLSMINYPKYIGYDVSKKIIESNIKKYIKHTFLNSLDDLIPVDVTLSLDVIYHLVEDDIYYTHLESLFKLSKEYVIIYSTDVEDDKHGSSHYADRNFSSDVARLYPDFKLIDRIKNQTSSLCDFFIYKKEKND